MFGKNIVTAPYSDRSGALKVNELWYTLQGEGPDAGRAAMFLRLSHCNLRCYFCDTSFDTGDEFSLNLIVKAVREMSAQHGCSLLVVTGGEPLLQNIVPLVQAVNACGISVSVETAGTVFYEELEVVFSPVRAIKDNLIVCSPKTPKVSAKLEKLVGAWKYIVKVGECGIAGLPNMSTQIPGRVANIFMPNDVSIPIFLQAMDEQDVEKNEANIRFAAELCMKYNYRLSVQMHKLANLK